MESVRLNNGLQMPLIGYGVYLVDPSVTERCVLDALSVGYRSIDTAQYYENEARAITWKDGRPMRPSIIRKITNKKRHRVP